MALPSPPTDGCPSALTWNYAGILCGDSWWSMSHIPLSASTSSWIVND
jgi:hypothetical protein